MTISRHEVEGVSKPGSTARVCVADQILQQMSDLCSRAEHLAIRTTDKLSPILGQNHSILGSEPDTQDQEYPPLFNEMRTNLTIINTHLATIENVIDRTEV